MQGSEGTAGSCLHERETVVSHHGVTTCENSGVVGARLHGRVKSGRAEAAGGDG
jgi:hypothetical protein